MREENANNSPALGVLEWLRPGEHERALALIKDLRKLNIKYLRTGLSWADWHTEEGREWFRWLVPTLAKEVQILPCFTYTPPSIGIEEKTSAPPRDISYYVHFVETMINDYDEHFSWIELWNEPNNLNDWDWHLDPNWEIFSEMITMAAKRAREMGKKTVLAGMCPTDPNWLSLMCERGVVQNFDAVGIHGFPGTWEFTQETWADKIRQVKEVLDYHQLKPEVWITEVGYSTWRHDEIIQVKKFIEVLEAPADRIYWYCGYDLHPYESHQDGFHEDERHYHFGLKTADGTPKLIYRIWEQSGIDGLRKLSQSVFDSGAGLKRAPTNGPRPQISKASSSSRNEKPVLITGGAGFVGTNLAKHLLNEGKQVLIFDNLGRAGVEQNLEWLCDEFGDQVQLEIGDIRDAHLVRDAVDHASQVYHFAAQVAVTTSLDSPEYDFDINLRGTLNVLESMRRLSSPPPLLFTSTNKVYGALENVELEMRGERYVPKATQFQNGVSEQQHLDFHSPYGCSKGAADQYVLDYARSYNLPAVVFRMSCIYGEHQFGTEDQGWVAHFLLQALRNKPLTIYGDGCQVRDVLYAKDLINAMTTAQANIQQLSGRAFNIGGGKANAISLRELLSRLEALTGVKPDCRFDDWRQGDQKYYVSNTSAFEKATGWKPQVGIEEGLANMRLWIERNTSYSPLNLQLAKKGVDHHAIA
ncbi:NAD-dependent epimerase/dehydratase family protein [Alteromonas pelagimontana]|uniref:NAD-dependent epimerase/dehydratase family protein n=1 Tax=Alteromonas pelagimontana TaxID=1858656 RepID=A0A6M4MDD8_9ALTE|nr:NAD-dependent epimerase/dehydratase family protein [Alteromonas pelagimontana]QJR80585.1 NAD-dependent epimerase/dehydratase family protein [Alteromonas pelagimontana]